MTNSTSSQNKKDSNKIIQKRKVSEQNDSYLQKYYIVKGSKEIYAQQYKPIKSNCQIVLLHNLNSHLDQYHEVAKLFCYNKITLTTFDFSNFGCSKSEKQQDLKLLYKDIQLILDDIRIDLPLFLIGHGYMASLLIDLAQKNTKLNLAGIIPICPIFDQQYNLFDYILSKMTFMNIKVQNPLINCTGLVKEHKQIPQILHDNLVQQTISHKLYYELIQITRNLTSKIMQPILLIGSKQDYYSSHTKLQKYYNNLKSDNKQIMIIDQSYHDVFKGKDTQQITDKILKWIKIQSDDYFMFRSNIYFQQDNNDEKIKLNYKQQNFKIIQQILQYFIKWFLSGMIISSFFYYVQKYTEQNIYNSKLFRHLGLIRFISQFLIK